MTAAIYTRISRSDDDEDRAAVERQEADCRVLLARLGVNESRVFCDNGVSAWNPRAARPGWTSLLAAIEAGEVDTVAVWHADRLMRLPRDLEFLLDAHDRHGVRLVSVGGSRDLGDPDDRFILRIEVAHACRSSDDTSRRLRRKFEQNALEGKPHGGPRPFGVSRDRTQLVETEAEAVGEIARRLLAGESVRSVTRWLNTTGLEPTGKSTTAGRSTTWSGPTIKQMLRRPSIAGLRQYKGAVVGRTTHPAILDEDTWTAVVTLLTDPSRRRTTSNSRVHLLSGILRCGRCGDYLRRVPLRLPRYVCKSCTKISIVQEKTDLFVTEAIKERARSLRLRPKHARQATDNLGTKLVAARARLQQVAEAFADDPDVSPDQFRTISRRIRQQIANLEAEQARRLDARVAVAITPDVVDSFDSLDLGRRQAIIRAIAPEIVVMPGRKGQRFDHERIAITWG